MLRDSATGFTNAKCDFQQLRALRREPTVVNLDRDFWQECVAMGWPAIPFAETDGGLGLGYAELGVIAEELGRNLLHTPMLSTVVLAGSVIDLAASGSQKIELLRGIVDGSTLYGFACQEGPNHHLKQIDTSLVPDRSGFRLSGRKVLVLDGGIADRLLVLARLKTADDEPGELALVLVDADTGGINRKNNLLLDGRYAANIDFDNVPVSESHLLIVGDRVSPIVDQVFDRAAVYLAAEMLGGIQESFDRTLEYLRTREQFGVKIGSFQGLKHRAARWFCEVELSRSIVLEALRALDDQADDGALLASTCKARVSDTYLLSGREGIQMHGGIGVTDEHDIGLFMKHAQVTASLFGDAVFHRQRFAELKGY